MQQRLPSQLAVPIGFAHRGARAMAPDNTIEAFRLALEHGATGLESDVWLTREGEPVLVHDGVLGRIRKRKIADLRRDELPAWMPSLRDLIEACGTDFHLSLDIKDPRSAPSVIAVLSEVAPELMPRTWLCHADIGLLAELRQDHPTVKLVNSTRLARLPVGPERRAAELAAAGIDGVNLRKEDWNGGLVALFHRFERTAFSWDLQHDHELRDALRMGIDAVYSDHVDRMMAALEAEAGG
jgi:glycerophosphoryl diester phosphodiesterase